jgi:hypothetical protein
MAASVQEQTLIEKEIDTLYQQALAGEKRGKLVASLRRVLAYLLKFVAAGGSLVVATGYLPAWNQHIGVAILIAVLLDSVSSNHKRLLSEVQAGYAYEFLRQRVTREYNRKLDPILKERRRLAAAGEPTAVTDSAVDALQQKTHTDLTDGLQQIREKVAAADIKALETLTLDNERAAAQQKPI